MKTTPFFLFIVLFSLLFAFTACHKQNTEWKGTVTEEDGIIIVKNPKDPIYGEDVFSLEEELSIGEAEGNEEYMFFGISGIAIDNEDRIYVVDYIEANIKVYDRNGEYLKTIGKEGQGPGELEMPSDISITYQKEIMVEEMRTRHLKFFLLEGEYLKKLTPDFLSSMPGLRMDSKGNFIKGAFFILDDRPRFELIRLDSELDFINTIDTFPVGRIIIGKPINPFAPKLCWVLDKDDNIVYGYPKKYEIKISNSEGKVLKKIIKEYVPVKIDEKAKREWEEEMKKQSPQIELVFPKYYNPYEFIYLDDEGRIYVRTYEKSENGEGFCYDVFDGEGRYIAKVQPETKLYIFNKDKMYTVEEDAEGYHVVKRYKVNWKY